MLLVDIGALLGAKRAGVRRQQGSMRRANLGIIVARNAMNCGNGMNSLASAIGSRSTWPLYMIRIKWASGGLPTLSTRRYSSRDMYEALSERSGRQRLPTTDAVVLQRRPWELVIDTKGAQEKHDRARVMAAVQRELGKRPPKNRLLQVAMDLAQQWPNHQATTADSVWVLDHAVDTEPILPTQVSIKSRTANASR